MRKNNRMLNPKSALTSFLLGSDRRRPGFEFGAHRLAYWAKTKPLNKDGLPENKTGLPILEAPTALSNVGGATTSRKTSVQQTEPNGKRVVVIGKESAGKSELVAGLTEKTAYISNFRGSTISCDCYEHEDLIFIDTPGILYAADAETTRAAMNQVIKGDTILIIVKATNIDQDLADILPLAIAKKGIIVVTFWDKVGKDLLQDNPLRALSKASGLQVIPVDARNLSSEDRQRILHSVRDPQPVTHSHLPFRWGQVIEPRPTWLEHRHFGPPLAVSLLLAPAVTAIWLANSLAARIDSLVRPSTRALAEMFQLWPSPFSDVLAGPYGLFTMGPLLLVWAVPTVVLYAVILGFFKASGLLDRITVAIHPVVRPFGLGGREIVRVMMGYGCNVPAVISTRACSSCSRGTCISAIAFGSACSYQLGASLGVFTAAGRPWLVIPYLLYLVVTTLIYTRLTTPPSTRMKLSLLLIEKRCFLQMPRLNSIWMESRGMLGHFFKKAMPTFLMITIVVSLLNYLHLIELVANFFSHFMTIFGLPAETSLPVIVAIVRKDGILLLAQEDLLATLSSGQILTAVYLASVLLPCVVTVLTIAKEQSTRFAAKLICRQAIASIGFSMILALSGMLFMG